jgi:hypothetical protein
MERRGPWRGAPCHSSAAVAPVYITKAMTGLGLPTAQKEDATHTEKEKEGGKGARRHVTLTL